MNWLLAAAPGEGGEMTIWKMEKGGKMAIFILCG